MNSQKINESIRETLEAARDSITNNLNRKEFLSSIEAAALLMKKSGGRIITTGMGKSGLIARKVAATLTSTGTPSVYLHPADALHGDVGNVQEKEVVLAYSNSGETREIIELLPVIRLLGGNLIAVTQKVNSTLADRADNAIIFNLTKEGCPLNLAPMASTTMSLVIGDTLAAALIYMKGFQPRDFGRYHPSGSLGRKLLTKVKDVMLDVKDLFVKEETPFREILNRLVSSNIGCVLICDSKGSLRGIITDGDIKRIMDHHDKNPASLWNMLASDLMTPDPLVIDSDALVELAINLMQKKGVYSLAVVDQGKNPIGLIRMHEALG